MWKQILFLTVLFLTGCATVPPDTFVVTPELLKQRQLETRKYDGIKEMDLLVACSNVLQDLGFNLENSETKLGVLTASKLRDATNDGETLAAVFMAIFFQARMVRDKDQTIRVSLVVRPVNDSHGKEMSDSHYVRVTFQRVLRRSDESKVYETLRDSELYQGFYEKVSKSVFLEAQNI
jgi:hypothetical protein